MLDTAALIEFAAGITSVSARSWSLRHRREAARRWCPRATRQSGVSLALCMRLVDAMPMQIPSGFYATLASGIGFVVATIMLVLGVYFVARKLLHPGKEGDRTHEVAANVAVRVATLHSLILGLVYAQELDDYKGVRANLIEEAVAISDVFNDARRYGGPMTVPVQHGLAQYVTVVVDEEWDRLGQHKGLSPTAWRKWEGVYATLLDLEPTSNRERYLSERMKDRVAAIARYRQLREATSISGFSGLFWGPAVIGLIIVSATLYVFRPTRTNIILFSLFGAYSGVILFFIFSFGDPYSNPARLEPSPFQHLLKTNLGRALH